MAIFLLAGSGFSKTVTIDASQKKYPFEGWGTAICWWGNIVGNYSDETFEEICDLLFDTADGLGLNILRYNIGGGDHPNHNHMGAGRKMDGFLDGAGREYNWTRDYGQIRVLKAAKARIPEKDFIVEGFSNSPPYWMTVSGCASGHASGSDNLKNEHYETFADYLTEVAKHFHEEWGITFRTIEPLNEPVSNWWKANGGQEGCHFSRGNQARIIRTLYEKIQSKQLPCHVAAPDETGYDETVATYQSFDEETRNCIYQINTHGYSGSKRKELRDFADRDKKILWSSEIDGSGAAAPFDKWTHNHNDIVPGLDIANRIMKDLNGMQINGWIFWQAVESEQAQIRLNKNWGCIHADFESGGETYHVPKKYYAVKQFSHFVKSGSHLLLQDDPNTVAFIGPDEHFGHPLTIIHRNAGSSEEEFTYKLDGFADNGSIAEVYRTSANENCKKLEDVAMQHDELTVKFAARSITTLVIDADFLTGSINTRVEKNNQALNHVSFSRSNPNSLLCHKNCEGTLRIKLYDLRGRHILSWNLENSVERIDISTFATQPLIARMQGAFHYSTILPPQ